MTIKYPQKLNQQTCLGSLCCAGIVWRIPLWDKDLDYVTRGTLLAQALYRMLSKPSHLLTSFLNVTFWIIHCRVVVK